MKITQDGSTYTVVTEGATDRSDLSFLLYVSDMAIEYQIREWWGLFNCLGYGGCILKCTYNHPKGQEIATTDQGLSGMIVHGHIGFTSKGWWLREDVEARKQAGLGEIPTYDPNTATCDFATFLAEEFPHPEG